MYRALSPLNGRHRELGARLVDFAGWEMPLHYEGIHAEAVSEVVAPLSGRVVAVNEAALRDPGTINESPCEDGWLVKVALGAPAEIEQLLSPSAYREVVL